VWRKEQYLSADDERSMIARRPLVLFAQSALTERFEGDAFRDTEKLAHDAMVSGAMSAQQALHVTLARRLVLRYFGTGGTMTRRSMGASWRRSGLCLAGGIGGAQRDAHRRATHTVADRCGVEGGTGGVPLRMAHRDLFFVFPRVKAYFAHCPGSWLGPDLGRVPRLLDSGASYSSHRGDWWPIHCSAPALWQRAGAFLRLRHLLQIASLSLGAFWDAFSEAFAGWHTAGIFSGKGESETRVQGVCFQRAGHRYFLVLY
jgi:hypothetical protein